MQIEAAYLDLKNKVQSMGSADAKSGLNPEIVQSILRGYACSYVEKDFAEQIRHREVIRNKLTDLKSQMENIIKNIKEHNNSIQNTPVSSIYKAVFYYLLPAIVYILCDVFFSKELIVKGWGLGLSSQVETWTLAIGIGLAPFLVKFIIDRFVEPAYLSDSKFLKRFITGFYTILCITVIGSFLQVAYLRGIIFKYTKISVEGNAYDAIYTQSPHVLTISFVTVAFMFVIGGGVLMSIGGKELSNWALIRKLQKQIKGLEEKQTIMKEKITEYYGLIAQSDFINLDEKRIDSEKERIAKELSYEYEATYKLRLVEMNEALRQKELLENESSKNFHEFTREILDKESRNGINQMQKWKYGHE